MSESMIVVRQIRAVTFGSLLVENFPQGTPSSESPHVHIPTTSLGHGEGLELRARWRISDSTRGQEP